MVQITNNYFHKHNKKSRKEICCSCCCCSPVLFWFRFANFRAKEIIGIKRIRNSWDIASIKQLVICNCVKVFIFSRQESALCSMCKHFVLLISLRYSRFIPLNFTGSQRAIRNVWIKEIGDRIIVYIPFISLNVAEMLHFIFLVIGTILLIYDIILFIIIVMMMLMIIIVFVIVGIIILILYQYLISKLITIINVNTRNFIRILEVIIIVIAKIMLFMITWIVIILLILLLIISI